MPVLCCAVTVAFSFVRSFACNSVYDNFDMHICGPFFSFCFNQSECTYVLELKTENEIERERKLFFGDIRFHLINRILLLFFFSFILEIYFDPYARSVVFYALHGSICKRLKSSLPAIFRHLTIVERERTLSNAYK